MAAPINVFFIRGLSTLGHDNAKWSVFDFGPIHRHFKTALEKRGLQFLPVLGMGAGSLQEIAKRAALQIESHPVWQGGSPVHILGHSAGGLVARLVMRELENKNSGQVLSCLTVASPHLGSRLSEICFSMPQTHRGSTRLLRSFGYDIGAKRAFFDELRPESVSRLFTPQTYQGGMASVVCWEPRDKWCAPLKLFQVVKAFREFDLPSDGVVERDSQAFGNVIAELGIDHFRQVGLFGEPQKFEKMCTVIADYFKTQQRR